MALTQRLQIRQSQALVMTPQLMQAIKLLQLSNLDLVAYVEAELERNPLLDRSADDEQGRRTRPATPAAPDEPAAEGETWTRRAHPSRAAARSKSALDAPTDDVFPDDGRAEPAARGRERPAGLFGMGGGRRRRPRRRRIQSRSLRSAETTLADWLREQLALAVADPARRMIGQYLIDLVDEAGYLSGDLAAAAEKLGTGVAEVEAVLGILQGFDPPGICARDLAECLALQLKERDRFDPAMAALIARLDLLARRDFAALKKVCGVGDEDLADMIAEIRRLNPKPGLAFGSAVGAADRAGRLRARRARTAAGSSSSIPTRCRRCWSIRATMPRSRPRRGATPTKSYLAECLQSATWLVRALDQRARTILKVANEIVRQQDGFFARGVEHLRPLNLKTVAEAIGMHESTVSRVTANKYMATSRGIFELKYFFTSAIAAAARRRSALGRGGAPPHQAADRRRERAADVLSDDTIVEKLREAGIDIARRTVAKYREAMRIPSSVQRRREKQAAAVA